jgi:hypothetical protein
MKLAWALILLIMIPKSARASGDAEGEVGLDFLHAGIFQNPPVSGEPETIVAQEMGVRVRLRARELDRRLSLDIDYRGREPIGGDVQDQAMRLLYAGELRYQIIAGTLTAGAGRFVAPSVAFLPVDGGRFDLAIDRLIFSAFGGRRAITTSLRNVELSTFLPAAGASAVYEDALLFAEAAYAYSGDRATIAETDQTYRASSAYVRALSRLLPEISAGGQIAFSQRASYLLGPTWTTVALSVHAADLFSGSFFVDWRPLKELRLTYDLQYQRTEIARDGQTSQLALVDPRFTDNQLRAAYRLFDVGWLRGAFRWRARNDRQERRYTIGADLDRLPLLGLFARGFVTYEDVSLDHPGPNLDRTLWSASLGYRLSGLDLEAGASFIERRAGPLSGLVATPRDPNDPSRPVDLSPFVLEAQRIAFVRAFYAGDIWFAGLDAEQNLVDAHERRFFAQLGALVEGEW